MFLFIDEALSYFAFELFSDYIPASLSNALYAEWKIQKPSLMGSENLTKRKLEITKTVVTKVWFINKNLFIQLIIFRRKTNQRNASSWRLAKAQ